MGCAYCEDQMNWGMQNALGQCMTKSRPYVSVTYPYYAKNNRQTTRDKTLTTHLRNDIY